MKREQQRKTREFLQTIYLNDYHNKIFKVYNETQEKELKDNLTNFNKIILKDINFLEKIYNGHKKDIEIEQSVFFENLEIWHKTQNIKIDFNSATEILTIKTKTQQRKFDTFYEPQGAFDIENTIKELLKDNKDILYKELNKFRKSYIYQDLLKNFDLIDLEEQEQEQFLKLNIRTQRKIIKLLKNNNLNDIKEELKKLLKGK